ncbi:adenylate/guanylate cyclase domain-containing protein [Propionivibrio sp.]|uniref:CHASE2 domain-containing protein n=1 Tax=Propionivibrio sp. TaxID=2212460 RepID=UPI0026393D35|nr:adenylate/guanylate cyclase domain-containing protein [Propionivibrio sp.]
MKKNLIRIALGLALALVLFGHSANIYQIPLLNTLDAFVYDARLRLTARGGVDERIVIVDINEKSLAEVGRWPWSRDKMAALVTQLFDHYGIALLGFDVVFAEPDSSSGLSSLEAVANDELKGDAAFQSVLKGLRGALNYDQRFAETLRNRPVVLGYYFTSLDAVHKSGALPDAVIQAGTFKGKHVDFTSWSGYGANLPEFQKNAGSAGHFNPIVDFDGVSRRVPMLVEHEGKYYESLSLAMARVLLGKPQLTPGYPEEDIFSSKNYGAMEWLDLPLDGGKVVRIPVDEQAASLIPYRGAEGSFTYVSAADVLSGRLQQEQLKGKIVLFGTTAPGLMDLRATPVGSTYPGVEIHANLLAGILDGSIKQKPSYVLGADVLLLSLCALLLALLLPVLSPLRATLLAFSLLLGVTVLNFGLWWAGLMMPLAAVVSAILGLYALNMSWGFFVESRSKRQFTELFGQYVPPELVDEMARDPERYSMEGKNEELTVLFSDVRGFTSISEGLDPKELTQLMNAYLGAMTAVVQKNRGTLDKYIGDAIMAFWGAPVADVDHARHAVLTALEMQVELRRLDEPFKARGWAALHIGVGINSGTMTVGDMGSKVRKSYTVMGDAVNLGSRLEGLTKQYGVGIIVSASTRALVKDLVYRELDRVRVKGKGEPVSIFEPLAAPIDKAEQDELKLWNQALRLYRQQDWDQAELQLYNLSRISPQRTLYQVYTERIAFYREHPPGEDWDGVTTFETK